MANAQNPPGAQGAASGQLSLVEGLFYAQIRLPGADSPVRVALHGITDHTQAAQAALLLARSDLTTPSTC